MTNYPREITEEENFVPRFDDKIERTHVRSGTVIVGTIYRIDDQGLAYDSNGMVLYSLESLVNNQSTYRLLYREPQKLKVGDIIAWEFAQHLPNGSVLTVLYGYNNNDYAYDVVLVDTDTGLRNRIQRVDKSYSWARFNPTRKVKIKFIND